MSDWGDEQARLFREQRIRDQQKYDDERRHRQKLEQEKRHHREQVALERQRDRAASMRAEGFSEGEIRSAERKRGCLSALVTAGLTLAAVATLVVLTSQPDDDNQTEGSLESPDDFSSVELQQVPETITSENITDEVEALPVAAPDTGEPAVTDAAAEEIIFVQNPVVQALPTDETTDAEQDNVTIPDGQSID